MIEVRRAMGAMEVPEEQAVVALLWQAVQEEGR